MVFKREKQKLFKWRISYLIKTILIRFIGINLTTRLLLNISWISGRLAFETCGQVFGDEFRNGALGLNSDNLLSLISRSDSVLDVGCGTGRWSEIVAEKAKKVVGIDYDSTNIAIANGRGCNAEFKLLDINDGMKDLGKFNVAILIHLLEHIDNPQVLLASLRSNCESLIIEVPDRDSNPLNWARIKMGLDYYTDADHVREYSVGELREDLEKSGWHEFDYQCVGGSIIAKVK
jgi:2-polyprenyl-3-methyl-5-hydroxy-6-metoxy-1,4-benzoquinol methylase